MKKEPRRQLRGEHVYIDDIYDKRKKVAQHTNQTGKDFGAYLQSIRSNLLDLDIAGAPNKTQLIHHMRQGLKLEIRATLYQNPTVHKDWPIFVEDVTRAESSIHQENKSFS